jgi:hypothetical protein
MKKPFGGGMGATLATIADCVQVLFSQPAHAEVAA